MTLKEMAVTYRLEADRLRHRIQLVRELPTRTEVERTAKIERLRLWRPCAGMYGIWP